MNYTEGAYKKGKSTVLYFYHYVRCLLLFAFALLTEENEEGGAGHIY